MATKITMPGTDMSTTIDLQPFCVDCDRVAIESPWSAGGYTYATDSRVLVRVPTTDPDSPPPEYGRRPNCEYALGQFDFAAPMESPALVPVAGLIDCRKCKTRECEECDGHGDVECEECGHLSPCDKCRGTGQSVTRCGQCDGGKVKGVTAYRTATQHFDARRVELVMGLPGVKWRVERDYLLFCFAGGGVGVLVSNACGPA